MKRALIAFALLLGVCAPALAELEVLSQPGLAFSASYPAKAQAKVNAAIQRKDCRFLGGIGLNAWTNLRYVGDAKALNGMLDALAKCPGITLHVAFRKPTPGTDDFDWQVGHMAWDNRIQVEVNLREGGIRPEDVYIPEVKGPALQR
jgi:hypothetical protein